MSQSVDYLGRFGRNYQERIERAISSIQAGGGVMIVDDNNRENEGDLVFSAEQMTEQQMALMIRECSGIVCLCLTDEKIKELDLPMMVENNTSPFQTAFTISIEAKEGVTTGVSNPRGSHPPGTRFPAQGARERRAHETRPHRGDR